MIQLGSIPDSPFTYPLQLLSECHRRIERFLETLILVARTAQGGELNAEQRRAMEAALRYFQEAAPLHSQDEEASLFPRIRATGDAEAEASLQAIDNLESDHRIADQLHAEADALGRQWLDSGGLGSEEILRLNAVLDELRELYGRHIALEDNAVFPLAGKLLKPDAIGAMGREMAQRRGLNIDRITAAPRYQPRKPAGTGE